MESTSDIQDDRLSSVNISSTGGTDDLASMTSRENSILSSGVGVRMSLVSYSFVLSALRVKH